MVRGRFAGLDVFLAVAERGSFSAAAADLGVKPPAVSQQIRQLEERLGTPLFYRTTRAVGLTEAGQRLFERCRPAAEELTSAIHSIGDFRAAPSGLLRLNVPRLALPYVIEPVLPGFRAAYPKVRVEVYVDDSLANIVESGFDAGIRLGSMVDKDMVAVALTPPMRSVVVGAPAYLERRGRPQRPDDLLAHDCICYRQITSGGLYRWEFEDGEQDIAVPVDGALIVNDPWVALQGALDGLGLAYLFDVMTLDHERQGRLERVLASHSVEEPGLHIYFPSRSQVMSKLRAFIDYARHALMS